MSKSERGVWDEVLESGIYTEKAPSILKSLRASSAIGGPTGVYEVRDGILGLQIFILRISWAIAESMKM